MAKAEELFGDDILFMPDDNKKKQRDGDWKRPLQKGEYFGHIKSVDMTDVSFKNWKATVYNYRVQLSDENKTIKFKYGDEEYMGADYVGREVRSLGVFKFLTPGEDDDFEANPTGNDRYLLFCQTLGAEIKKVKRVIDGEEVTLESMPNLSAEDIIGKPVMAVIAKGKPFDLKSGKTIFPWEVKFVKPWEEGEMRDFTEEIPF